MVLFCRRTRKFWLSHWKIQRFIQYKADDEKVHELERDIAKYWKDGEVELAICGIENQSSVENICRFELWNMMEQRIAVSCKKQKKILPGYDDCSLLWNRTSLVCKKNIKALMKIPDGMEKYINDYKIQIFEVAWLTEERNRKGFKAIFPYCGKFFAQKEK